MTTSTAYALISPCRNEADYMRETLDTVVAQSVTPAIWVIVDDGSSDATPAILAEYAARHAWIRIVTRKDRGHRAVGPGVIDAFYAGYETIRPDDYAFVCKLDLDLRLPPRYFEILIERMLAEPRMATCSGKAYIEEGGKLIAERHGDETSLGMTKFYRVQAFKQIGGFVREVMWDGIDCHECRRQGWIARSWDEPELRFVHLRPMGSSQQSVYTGRMRHGFGQYFMGTGPVYMAASALLRMTQRPYVLGSLAMFWGYLKSALKGAPRYGDEGFRRFLRKYQWRSLLVGKQRATAEIDRRNAERSPEPLRAANGREHGLKIAYLVNQYPKVSHTFIRREILALERQGVSVARFALRGWDADVKGAEDLAERDRTRHILREGVAPLLLRACGARWRAPVRAWRALRAAWQMSRHAERSWPYHLMYFIEACTLADWLREAGVEHVHAHFGTNSTEVAQLAHLLGGPSYSFTVHGPEEFDKPRFLHLTHKIRDAAFVVAISSYGRSQLWRWLPGPEWDKVSVVHCALEASFFQDSASVTARPVPRLVNVGRLCAQKGQLLLVEAAALLKQEGLRFELVLAGDGEMRDAIEAAIARHHLGDSVRITGWVDSATVRREMLESRALVLPSFAEGLPVVIMEAMAVGRPVVTTRIAGIPELVREGVDGWLVPPGDIVELKRAMRACLETEPGRLLEMGRAANERVRQRHDADVEAAKLKALFEASRSGVAVQGVVPAAST